MLLLGNVLVGMHFSIVSRSNVSQFDAPTSPSTMTLEASTISTFKVYKVVSPDLSWDLECSKDIAERVCHYGPGCQLGG